MITFSNDPQRAEHEMHAVIFYLVTFGYIDGDFDAAEKSFVREIIRKLIEHRATSAMPNAAPAALAEVVEKFTRHFHEVFEGIDHNVKELFTESVSEGEDPRAFVHSKLKVKCFEIFQGFDRRGQTELMNLIDTLLLADGVAHPAEVQFRGELAQLLQGDLDVELTPVSTRSVESASRVAVSKPVDAGASHVDHPFFKPFEFHFSRDPEALNRQVAADRALIDRALAVLEQQRAHGNGRLTGKRTLSELAGTEPFLDGHPYVRLPKAGTRTELTVLGDLHGCYSILKATVLQSKFFERVINSRSFKPRFFCKILNGCFAKLERCKVDLCRFFAQAEVFENLCIVFHSLILSHWKTKVKLLSNNSTKYIELTHAKI